MTTPTPPVTTPEQLMERLHTLYLERAMLLHERNPDLARRYFDVCRTLAQDIAESDDARRDLR